MATRKKEEEEENSSPVRMTESTHTYHREECFVSHRSVYVMEGLREKCVGVGHVTIRSVNCVRGDRRAHHVSQYSGVYIYMHIKYGIYVW